MYHSHRTPRRRKSKDEETCKANHSRCCFFGVLWRFTIEREVADGCENEKAYKHPCRAGEERFTTPVVLNDVETVEGDAEVDTVLNGSQRDELVCDDGAENVPRSSALRMSC
jgi:hypothetical protein